MAKDSSKADINPRTRLLRSIAWVKMDDKPGNGWRYMVDVVSALTAQGFTRDEIIDGAGVGEELYDEIVASEDYRVRLAYHESIVESGPERARKMAKFSAPFAVAAAAEVVQKDLPGKQDAVKFISEVSGLVGRQEGRGGNVYVINIDGKQANFLNQVAGELPELELEWKKLQETN